MAQDNEALFTPCIGKIYITRSQVVKENFKKVGGVKGTIGASVGYDKRLDLDVVDFEPKTDEAHWIWRTGGGIQRIPTKAFKLEKSIDQQMENFFRDSIPKFLEGLPIGIDETLLRTTYEGHSQNHCLKTALLMAVSTRVFFKDFFRIEEGKELTKAPFYAPLGIYLLSYQLTVELEAVTNGFINKMETDFVSNLKREKSPVVWASIFAYDMALAELDRGYHCWLNGRTKVPDEAAAAWPLEEDLGQEIAKIEAQRLKIKHILNELVG